MSNILILLRYFTTSVSTDLAITVSREQLRYRISEYLKQYMEVGSNLALVLKDIFRNELLRGLPVANQITNPNNTLRIQQLFLANVKNLGVSQVTYSHDATETLIGVIRRDEHTFTTLYVANGVRYEYLISMYS